MVIGDGAVVNHAGDVGVVALVVVVERVEEDAETVPLVFGAEHGTLLHPLSGVPHGLQHTNHGLTHEPRVTVTHEPRVNTRTTGNSNTRTTG